MPYLERGGQRVYSGVELHRAIRYRRVLSDCRADPQLGKALTGIVLPHHRFLLAKQLVHIDFRDEQIEEISAEIGRQREATSRPPDRSEPDTGQGAEGGSITGGGEPPLT